VGIANYLAEQAVQVRETDEAGTWTISFHGLDGRTIDCVGRDSRGDAEVIAAGIREVLADVICFGFRALRTREEDGQASETGG
jgi:hypothetical protein